MTIDQIINVLVTITLVELMMAIGLGVTFADMIGVARNWGLVARAALADYEWNFSDVNPPVHAWATLFLHRTEQALRGEADVDFLKSAFNKLVLNFTSWADRKDRFGKNVFEGGFLGLDNIGVFDRSAPLPTGGRLEQADGTAWMALSSQNMCELAIELAARDPAYEDMVVKFAEHFFYFAAAMNQPGARGMWDEEDGFYYDLLVLPDGSTTRLKVRSMVGLLPLCATTVIENWQRQRIPRAMIQLFERLRRMPELMDSIHPTGAGHLGVAERGLLALVNPEHLHRILSKMLDENEFLGPHGIRALSKFHQQHPYVFYVQGQEYRVDYLPAESNTGMFGGNSNWRGPVWMPVNAMIIRALLQFYLYYGDNFKVECPTGSGRMMNLFEVAKEIADRLTRTFLRDEQGRRPVYGGTEKFQSGSLRPQRTRAGAEPLDFELPPVPSECPGAWRRWLDTSRQSPDDICEWGGGTPVAAGQYTVQPRSLVVLVLRDTFDDPVTTGCAIGTVLRIS